MTKTLSRHEELELIRQAQGTGRAAERARDRVIELNMGLVWAMMKKLRPRGSRLEREDVEQLGRIGLAVALDRFDTTRGTKFSTYAIPWVMRYIRRGMDETGHTIRRPIWVTDTLFELLKIQEDFEQEHHRLPTFEELADLSGKPLATVQKVMEAPNGLLSLEEIVGNDDGNTKIADFIEDPDRYEAGVELRLLLEGVIDLLSEREQRVIRARFWEDRRLWDVADELGISREGVRQIEEYALKKLQRLMIQQMRRDICQIGAGEAVASIFR